MKGNKHLKRASALGLSLALSLTMCLTPAWAEGGMPEGGMPEGGGGNSSDHTAAPSVDYQTLDILGNYAGVFIRDGQVTVDGEMVSGEGTVDSTTISGVQITAENIGVWNKSNELEEGIAGKSGIVILNTSTGEAADDEVTIGGEEDLYTAPDGEKYNTVVVLDNQDGDEANTAYTDADWTIDNGDNSNCTYPGAGIAVSASKLTIQNSYIETKGFHRPALATYDSALAGDENAQSPTLIIEDSVLASWGSEGAGSSAPTFTCMYGSARPVIINASAPMMFFNSKVLSSDWGSYSLDQCSDTTVSIVNSYNENTVGGYGVYAIGSNTVDMYGTTSVSGQYGAILCAAGTAHIYNLEKALADSELMANYDGVITLEDAINEGGTNQMIAVNNAVTFTADMSGATVTSTLTAEDTAFATVESATADDGSEIKSVLETYDWLTNFSAISGGAPYFFLNYIDGATLCYRSVNSTLELTNCTLESKTGVVIQTVLGYDTSASGIDVADGTEYLGYDFTLTDMSVAGDILHEDYQRKMNLTLDSTALDGSVVTGTMASWNETMENYVNELWTVEDPAVGGVVGEVAEADGLTAEGIVEKLVKNDSYETFWGANLSLTNGSVWTVEDTSSVASLIVDGASSIQAPAGKTLSIYTGVAMSNEDVSYDVTTGTLVDALTAGETYENVVIVVSDAVEAPAEGEAPAETPAAPEAPEAPAEDEAPAEAPATPEAPADTTVVNPFADVAESDYFYAPVLWAVANGITAGTSDTTFSPDESCTRAQIVTFLYAQAGKPEVSGTMPFADVAESDYYYNAVLWAAQNGITAGTSATTFSPDEVCTRAQIVTFLYAKAGKPAVSGENPFTDVTADQYYFNAVQWAVANTITAGTTATTFSPADQCTRAQTVTFLYAEAGRP